MIGGYADFLKWATIFGLVAGSGGGSGAFYLVDAATFNNNPVTYNNGSAGIGATLTSSNPGLYVVDGKNVSTNALYLFKNQTDATQNGIYVCTNPGSASPLVRAIFTRLAGYDQPGDIYPGDLVGVVNGNTQAGTTWVETAVVSAVGTDPFIFSEFSAGVASLNGLIGALRITSVDGSVTVTPSGNTVDLSVGGLAGFFTPVMTIQQGATTVSVLSAQYDMTAVAAGARVNCAATANVLVDSTGQLVNMIVKGPIAENFTANDQAQLLGFTIRDIRYLPVPGGSGGGSLAQFYSNPAGPGSILSFEAAELSQTYQINLAWSYIIQSLFAKKKVIKK
jgi:hypothetical protein